MKIIEQGHEIISIPDNILAQIETAGRTCYKSEDKIGCSINGEDPDPESLRCPWYSEEDCRVYLCEHHSSQKFSKKLLNRGHHAMIEFGDIIVRLVTNRGVTHELVRHRLFSFAQESTRYVRYDGQMEFIRPVWWEQSKLYSQHQWLHAMKQAEKSYSVLLSDGWRPEQAREVLPNSLKTEIVVKGNIREWRHCLKLRTSKKAHPQIRALMLPLLDELQERVPVVFNDIYKSIGKKEK